MAADAGSYCNEAEVISYAQMGQYADGGSATVPTQTQVLQFQVDRAAEMYGWMVDVVGSSAPAPITDYSTTIDTSTDVGLALSRLLRQGNAKAAAADALEAAGSTQVPARSERVAELLVDFYALKDTVEILVESYLASSTLAANHFTEGRVTADTIVTRTQEGLTFDGDTEW